jgi:hypothetical protein
MRGSRQCGRLKVSERDHTEITRDFHFGCPDGHLLDTEALRMGQICSSPIPPHSLLIVTVVFRALGDCSRSAAAIIPRTHTGVRTPRLEP